MLKKQKQLATIALSSANICNALWLLGPIVNPSIDWIRQFASFYASSCEPHHVFFRVIDIAFCISMLIWAGLSWKNYNKLFVVIMATVGVATFSDSMFPAGCLRAEAPHLGLLQELHHIHAITSAIGFIASFIAISYIAFSLLQYKSYKKLAVSAYFITVILMLEYNYADFLPNNAFVGALQRLNILIFSLWLLTVPIFSKPRNQKRTKK